MPEAELERDDLIHGINSVIKKIRQRGEPAGIRIIGGAALAIRYFERRTTADIDAQFIPEEPILLAALEVAEEEGWPEDWLNNNASTYVPQFSVDMTWEMLYQDEVITVEVASLEGLLAMKVYASRLGRDEGDIANLLALCGVQSIDEVEAIMDRYYPGEGISEKAERLLSAIFEQGFPRPPRAVPPPVFG